MIRVLVVFLMLASRAWSGPITTYTYAFGRPMFGIDSTFVGNTPPACNSWVPTLSITNATSISWFMNANGGNNCSVTIYNDIGTTIITTTGSQSCNATGTVSVTGLTPFSLAAGTKYQVCVCGDLSAHWVTVDDSAVGGGAQQRNQLSVPLSLVGTNGCDGGTFAPPATLGAFHSANFHAPILLIGTDTP